MTNRWGTGRLLLIALWLVSGCSPKCYLKKTEQVDFFPTYVYQQADGQWVMPVTAWVHDSHPDASMERGIARVVTLMQIIPEVGTQAADLRGRVTPFLLKGQPKKTVPVKLSGKTIQLPPSDEDGFVKQEVKTPAPSSTSYAYATESCRDDSRQFTGKAIVIPSSGTSIISNVDPAPALAAVYQQWQGQGAVFHYVSNKPWQLFSTYSHALENQGFPEGVVHLQTLPIHSAGESIDSLIAALATVLGPSSSTKQPAIETVMTHFPGRRYILIGEAREKDEIAYAALARKHPRQVSRILIHIPSTESDPAIARAMTGLPSGLWKTFHDPAEIEPLR